ncbi:MFS transporter [bacterium CPR1]|nr:MFS transporter [bacterium CPR1]
MSQPVGGVTEPEVRKPGLLDPPPPAPPVPAEQVRPLFRYWRLRLLSSTFIGYAVYYIVRTNLPVAIKDMGRELNIDKGGQGIILTVHGLVYGVSKLFNGMIADRTNPRILMSIGILCSGVACFTFGLCHTLTALVVVWALNAWFQGMGFPPVARILSHWFSPGERGVSWGIFNTSHMFGAAIAAGLSGWLLHHYGWRSVFFVPAGIAVLCCFFLLDRLRDTPASLGLPPVEVYSGETELEHAGEPERELSSSEFKAFVYKHVWANPTIWILSLANFNVYVVRYAFLNWGPTYLQEARHFSKIASGGMVGAFEAAGLVGSLAAGVLTDRFFPHRRSAVCVAYMLGATLGCWLCAHTGYTKLSFILAGFTVYGPQFLVGVLMADIATKRAAATAIGLSGLFGYLSGLVSGWGIGALTERHGWDAAFDLVIASSLLSALLFAICWRARAREA